MRKTYRIKNSFSGEISCTVGCKHFITSFPLEEGLLSLTNKSAT
jgi:hypothetical protein